VKKLIVILALLVVVLAGAAYYVSRPAGNGDGNNGFQFQEVEFGTLTDTVSATGIVQPRRVAAVGSLASGQVIRVYPEADVEQRVRKGQPLLELDKEAAQLKLRAAQAKLKEARDDVKRRKNEQESAQKALDYAKELQKAGAFKKELLQAEATLGETNSAVILAEDEVGVAQVGVHAAQYALDLLTVRAPDEGIILERNVVLGQLIGPPASAALFKMAHDVEHLQVHAQVAEGDSSRIEEHQRAEFTVYAYSDNNSKFYGAVNQIRSMPNNLHGAVFYDTVIDVENQLDPRTRRALPALGASTACLLAGANGEGAWLATSALVPGRAAQTWMLRPGMTAQVDIVIRRHEEVWKLPVAALSLQLDESYQTPPARAQLADWHRRHQAGEDWKPVWILNEQKKPWPIFVRVGGKYQSGRYAGQTGIRDGQYIEVLEWDPELAVQPRPGARETHPQVIINAPPAHKPGLFDQPGRFKLS
jgi:multidrug efflux pump subunit AcrA (membrane-fusion protein)